MNRPAALLTVLVAACHADAPITAPAPATPAPSGAASIRADELRVHVEELSADDYAGRETLEPGYERAAQYLAARFQDYGLAPLPGHASFLVPYELERRGFDPAGTQLAVDGVAQAAGVDFAPFAFSDAGSAEAEVVFAGYGISAPDLGHDDYADLDVRGKLVLVLRHNPGYGGDDDRFAGTQHSFFVTKARVAQQHGAAGMLLVSGPVTSPQPDDLRLPTRLSVPEPAAADAAPAAAAKAEAPDGEETPPFLAVHVSRAVAATLVAGTGKSLAELQAAVDGGAAPSTLPLGERRAAIAVAQTEAPETVRPVNVVGYLEGADPARAGEWVVVGGHYDHLGGFAGDEGDTIYNGADDNASGTAGVLELAQAFAALPERPARSVVFIGFSGEEKGLLGSRALLAQGPLAAEHTVFMLNLDMIGRNGEQPVDLVGDGYATELGAIATTVNEGVGLAMKLGGLDYSGASDHHPFFTAGVPVLFFFTGLHDDYHQLSDHADKLDYGRMEQIVRLAYGITARVASGETTPLTIHRPMWMGAALQARDGRAVFTEVEDGSRAARAGVKVGDVLLGAGDDALERPRDVGALLAGVEPGSTARLRLERDGAPIEVAVERAKRGFLGIVPGRLPEDDRARLGLPDAEGVLLRDVVEGGPAAAAGMTAGDVLIRIAGLPVGTGDLGNHLARIGAGEPVSVVVVRDGERVPLELVLGERPEPPRP